MSDTPSTPNESAATPPPRIDPTPPKSLPPGAAKKPSRPPIRVPATASLAALLIVALALVGTSPYWAPPLMPLLPWSTPQTNPTADRTAQQLAAIQQQLAQLTSLNTRVATLENRPAPDASAVVAPLAAQVQQLDARIDQIDKLTAQLLRDAKDNAESPQRVLMISLAGLGNAIATSRPFGAELASVEAQAQNHKGWAASLQPLEASAKTGIPSTAVLAQRFSDDVAPAILRADANAPNDQQSMTESMWARLRSLVIIRRVDGIGGSGNNPTDQAVNEAQAALNKSDLAGAVKALGTLKGGAASAAQAWLKDAKLRVDAEQTIAKLSQDLAGDMAAAASGG